MKLVVFNGSPRKGNTYRATQIFLNGLKEHSDVEYTEFFLPEALPVFCTGCQLCLSGPHERCPHAQYVTPILEAVLAADALVFATPHHGASSMSAGMKSLFDHLDFLTMTVTPHTELFREKAFIISTATGSAAGIKPLKKSLKNWGANRVYSRALRMFINKWDAMPKTKQEHFEKILRRDANRFYRVHKGRPYVSTMFMYHMSKLIIKRYVGMDGYPYKYWQENGYFKKRPF